MLQDDIKKANFLGISYGEYMALKKDFYSGNISKAVKATARMAELIARTADRKREDKND